MAGCLGQSGSVGAAKPGTFGPWMRRSTTCPTTITTMIRGAISMPRKFPPFVECWRDRHGKVRVYFRRARGRRIPLPATIGSDEFDAAYHAALAGQLALSRE